MRRLGHLVAVAAQQATDAVEQLAPARLNAGHVLKDDELGQVRRERLQRQPDAAQRQPVQRLVFGTLRLALGQQAAEALAGRGQEDDVGALVPRCGVDVGRGCLAPVGRRLAAVERAILLAVEQVEHGALDAGEALEIVHRAGVHVDPAEAAELCDHVADARAAGVEALCTAAQPGEQVEVPYLAAIGERVDLHRGSLEGF